MEGHNTSGNLLFINFLAADDCESAAAVCDTGVEGCTGDVGVDDLFLSADIALLGAGNCACDDGIDGLTFLPRFGDGHRLEFGGVGDGHRRELVIELEGIGDGDGHRREFEGVGDGDGHRRELEGVGDGDGHRRELGGVGDLYLELTSLVLDRRVAVVVVVVVNPLLFSAGTSGLLMVSTADSLCNSCRASNTSIQTTQIRRHW